MQTVSFLLYARLKNDRSASSQESLSLVNRKYGLHVLLIVSGEEL